MTLFSIPPLVSAALFLLLGVFVLKKGAGSKLNFTFFLICLSTFWWQFSWFVLFNTTNAGLAEILVKVGYVGIIFIPITFFHFFLHFLEKKDLFDRIMLYGAYLSGVIFEIFLIFTNYFVEGYYEYFWGFYPRVGIVHRIYLLVLGLLVLRIMYLLFLAIRNKKSVSSYKFYQIKYFVFGFIFYAFSAFDFAVNYGLEVYPFGFVFILIFLGIVGYSIVRFRLMDIRIIAKKIFIYFWVSVFAYIVYSGLIATYPMIFGSVYSAGSALMGIFLAPLFVLLLFQFHNLVTHFSNRYLFYSLYNYQETINKLSAELNYYNDLDKIVSTIVRTIKDTMKLSRAGVLLINPNTKPVHYQIAKVIGFNEKNGISLVQDNFLTRYLEQTKKTLIVDELGYLAKTARKKEDRSSFEMLRQNMIHIEATLCLPLMSNNKLIGIIVLGGKISDDAYTKEDLELLETLSNQAGIAVENALLYKRVEEFNATLKQKVDEQTRDLREQAEHLEKLLEMRSEFLDIASHQLKTPVSVILGTSSMFKEGAMDKLPRKKQLHFIDNIFQKAKKLSSIISDILKASEMDTEEFKLIKENIKPTQMEEVISSVVEDLKPVADEKKIKLVFKAGRQTGRISADGDFLRHAIFNLVDNAIKYTKEGKVEIALTEDSGGVKLTVKDEGIGIPKEDQAKMFDKFARARNAVNMYTDGSGLGLFIVKKIIDAHGGKISFESDEGKGTTFTVTLPKHSKIKAQKSEKDHTKLLRYKINET